MKTLILAMVQMYTPKTIKLTDAARDFARIPKRTAIAKVQAGHAL